MRVIGLMSGTSMDAIDAAVVDIERGGEKLRFGLQTFVSIPYPPETAAALSAAIDHPLLAADIAALNFSVGEAFAEAASLAVREAEGTAELVGSHGQTISHHPKPDSAIGRTGSTLQIGEAAVIAERTGLTTVADFRVADIAAGGEGAPLVSYADYLLLRSQSETRAILNIGGIANITVLPAGATADQVRAFDTGPGNMPLDLATRTLFPDGPGFDRNGQIAARGRIQPALLERLLTDPFFKRLPPKTAGREQFGPEFLTRVFAVAKSQGIGPEDIIATLTELSARSIAHSLPSDCRRVIAGGGGVHNRTLMAALRQRLAQMPEQPELQTSDAYGLPPNAKEAIAFAILAYEAVCGVYNNLPHATGALHSAVLGKIVPGANYRELMRKVWVKTP